MKHLPLLVGLAALVFGSTALAQRSDLTTPQKRTEVVEAAAKLLQPRELAAIPETLIPPLNPPAFNQRDPDEAPSTVVTNQPARVTGDRAVLEALAGRLAPSGTAIIGGEAILLFGQKRLKVGDQLTITFEGIDYTLDITDIGRTTFTLRLNREEITRPIQSRK